MAQRTAQYVQVGKRKLELSNLEKVLFPEDHFVKAEIIQYYLTIAPTILSHIKGRALSLIRFPEGIHGESFFQKNRPQWAPEWIEYVQLGKEKKDYMMALEEATLVWLANLACLEMHQMHAKRPEFDHPDYFVFDLDPPEGYPFAQVVEIAFDLKTHIESYGYHPFAKTTGGKGVHIVIPVEPRWSFSDAFDAASDMAKPFVEQHEETTLHIKKEARKGRVLIDIFRNRASQTIVSPYSLRGRPGAPVSMPLSWEELKDVTDPNIYNLRTVPEKVLSEGDAWEGIAAYSTPLHTKSKQSHIKKDPGVSGKYKSPEQLKEYAAKRDFKKTTEPGPEAVPGSGHSFVVHRHHATRLHYDLRLEEDGVLKSWAVPRGMPPRPGIKRLAVQTEDHPMEYLTFEGVIPKGEYGAGNMWVYGEGKYEITKKKKDGFYFQLHGRQFEAEYRMHKTREKEWLLERVDNPQIDWIQAPIEPMLVSTSPDVPVSDDYIYEVKWDGLRALISVEEGKIRITSRNGNDLGPQFPELLIPEEAFRATNGVFDGEIVCLDQTGKANFTRVINRMQTRGEAAIERMKAKYPAHCYVFDCLYLDGRPLINDPLVRRREWVKDALKKKTPYRLSESVEDGKALFDAACQMGLEGIIAKEKQSRYQPGKRTTAWLKIKGRNTTECLIIGYTKGKGDREELFGALHLGEYENGELIYRGKVGTGFDQSMLREVYKKLKKLNTIQRPVATRPVDDHVTVWIEPELVCEIQYSSETENKTFREPVFLRLRPDLTGKH